MKFKKCRACGKFSEISLFPKNGKYYKPDCKKCISSRNLFFANQRKLKEDEELKSQTHHCLFCDEHKSLDNFIYKYLKKGKTLSDKCNSCVSLGHSLTKEEKRERNFLARVRNSKCNFQKLCPKCGQLKNSESFAFNKKTGDLRNYSCNDCQPKPSSNPKWVKRASRRRVLKKLNSGFKTCKKCGEDRELKFFSLDSSSDTGLAYYCKTCKSEANRNYRRKNSNVFCTDCGKTDNLVYAYDPFMGKHKHYCTDCAEENQVLEIS